MIHPLIDDLREFAEYAANHANDAYLSLYLMTDPGDAGNQAQTPSWQVFLRNALTDVEARQDSVQIKQWKNVRLSDAAPEKAWARLLQAVRAGATVECVHDEAAERVQEAGGIIAQLYYPIA